MCDSISLTTDHIPRRDIATGPDNIVEILGKERALESDLQGWTSRLSNAILSGIRVLEPTPSRGSEDVQLSQSIEEQRSEDTARRRGRVLLGEHLDPYSRPL